MSCEYYKEVGDSWYTRDCILCRNESAFRECMEEKNKLSCYDCRDDGYRREDKANYSYQDCPLRKFALSINYDPNKCVSLYFSYDMWDGLMGKCSRYGCKLTVDAIKRRCMSGGCSDYKRPDSGPCYISTACVVAKGLPDDCDELQTLRAFRDKMSKEDEAIAELVKEYYKNAPVIVEKINQEENSEEIYNFLYNNLVVACVTKLKENKNQDAVDIYTSIYQDLKKKYILDFAH